MTRSRSTTYLLTFLLGCGGVARYAAATEPIGVTEPIGANKPAGVAVITPPQSDLKINGSLDLYYMYNLNKPPLVTPPTEARPTQPAGNNQYRVFDLYHDDLALALAEITLQKTKGDVGVFIALGFGHNADVMSPVDEVSKNITQAVLTYKPSTQPRWTFMAGKMLTHMGLEVPKTKDNWNYSRSLIFGYGFPFWHMGGSAKYEISKELNATAFIYNSTQGLYTTSHSKSAGLQLTYSPGNQISAIYNLLAGPESTLAGESHTRYVHEFIGKYNINIHWSAVGDIVFGNLRHYYADGRSGRWFAWNGSLRWQNGRFALSPRFELYVDNSGASLPAPTNTPTPPPQRVDSETLTASYDCGDGLELRGEVRRDHSTTHVFLDASNTLLATQITSTIGILYDF